MRRFPTLIEQGILAILGDANRILQQTEDTLFNILDILKR